MPDEDSLEDEIEMLRDSSMDNSVTKLRGLLMGSPRAARSEAYLRAAKCLTHRADERTARPTEDSFWPLAGQSGSRADVSVLRMPLQKGRAGRAVAAYGGSQAASRSMG
jgi:hypothetical protein